MRTKLIERFSVFSKFQEGSVQLFLVYNEGNILVSKLKKSAQDEQEAKLLHQAYYSIMIERQMAIYALTYHLAKVFSIEHKGKDVNEVVKMIIQKVKEYEKVKSVGS